MSDPSALKCFLGAPINSEAAVHVEKRDHFLCKPLSELIQTEVITAQAELVIFLTSR